MKTSSPCQPKVMLRGGVPSCFSGKPIPGNTKTLPSCFRKHQGWWQALESRLRGELISRGLEKMLWARERKER